MRCQNHVYKVNFEEMFPKSVVSIARNTYECVFYILINVYTLYSNLVDVSRD